MVCRLLIHTSIVMNAIQIMITRFNCMLLIFLKAKLLAYQEDEEDDADDEEDDADDDDDEEDEEDSDDDDDDGEGRGRNVNTGDCDNIGGADRTAYQKPKTLHTGRYCTNMPYQ